MFFGGLDFYIYLFDLSEYIWGVVWVRYLSLVCFYGYLYGYFYLYLWIVKQADQPFHQPFRPFSSDGFNVICAMYPVPMYVWSLSGVSSYVLFVYLCAAAAAKSLQSCLTLCDPIDDSPPGSPIPGILQARTLEWVAISFSSAWKWKVKVRSLSRVRLLATPWTHLC